MPADVEIQEHNKAVMRRRLLDMREVAAILHVGRSTAFGLVASGELRSVRIGRRRLVSEDALDEFIRGLG